jgi:hypothetical protein
LILLPYRTPKNTDQLASLRSKEVVRDGFLTWTWASRVKKGRR